MIAALGFRASHLLPMSLKLTLTNNYYFIFFFIYSTLFYNSLCMKTKAAAVAIRLLTLLFLLNSFFIFI